MSVLNDLRKMKLRATVLAPTSKLTADDALPNQPSSWRQLFDGTPMALPGLREDAPSEIPRAVLESSDSRWRVEVRPQRLDASWTANDRDDARKPASRIYETLCGVLVDFAVARDVSVERLGAVSTRYFECPDSGTYLARHFCRRKWNEGQPFNRPDSFEIHAHKQYQLTESIRVNSWVRNKTRRLSMPDQESVDVILIEQDLNTPAEGAATVFNPTEMQAYFARVPDEFDEILSHYYPEDEE